MIHYMYNVSSKCRHRFIRRVERERCIVIGDNLAHTTINTRRARAACCRWLATFLPVRDCAHGRLHFEYVHFVYENG